MHPSTAPGGNGRLTNLNHETYSEADHGPDRGGTGDPLPDEDGRSGAPPSAAPKANGVDGRDGQGRFAAGNPGGPGNPFARQVAQLRRALLEAVAPEDVQAVARALLEKACGGDTAAAKLLFTYVLGKPTAAVDPDTLDLQEWQLYQQRPVAQQDFLRVLTQFPVDLACTLLRAALPGVTSGMAGLAAQLFARQEEKDEKTAARRKRARRRRNAVQGPVTGEPPAPAAVAVPPAEDTTIPQEAASNATAEAPAGAGGKPPADAPAGPATTQHAGGGTPAATEPVDPPAVVADDGPGEEPRRSREPAPGPPAAASAPVGPTRDQVGGETVEDLIEADAGLLHRLQATLSGLSIFRRSKDRAAPTTNGPNGDRAPPPGSAGSP